MDTNKLAVGQKVWMRSGPQLEEGTVIGISDYRIEVEIPQTVNRLDGRRVALHFRRNGIGGVAAPGDQCGVFFYYESAGGAGMNMIDGPLALNSDRGN